MLVYNGGIAMETYNAIVTMITTVGFPIAACVALFVQNATQQKQHKEEMDGIKEALNNNTLALQKLVDKIGE